MLPYLIAGAIGFVVAKLFEEDETPKYADGGYIKNIKKLYEEDGSDVYGGDFGQAGGINWRINPETNFLYLMGIGRNNRGENSVKSKGEGSRALAYLFELYPEVDKIYFEIEGEEEEGAWKFYKKIGAEEEGGGEITENTYNAELSRIALRNYFVQKNNPDIRFDGGGNVNDNLKEVKVNKIIYHQSNPMFRNDIKKMGLIPQGKSENWLSDTKIQGKVIFASNNDNKEKWFDSGYDDDIYEIDTTNLDNKWYLDPNFMLSEYIITFEPIPFSAIKLIHIGSGTYIG